MKVVVDTNIFLAVVMGEPERDRIITLTQGYELVAPAVLPFEAGNAFSAMIRRGLLTAEQAVAAWDLFQAIPLELRSIDIGAALHLVARFGIYAYDAYFLECALCVRLPLLTLDKGMKQVARDLKIRVLEIGT